MTRTAKQIAAGQRRSLRAMAKQLLADYLLEKAE